MNTTIIKEGHLQFYCLQKKKWLKHWVQLADRIMGGSLEVFPNQEDASDPQSRLLFVSFLSSNNINMQVVGIFKTQCNCFQIKAEGITYTFSTQNGSEVHEWISIIHNYIQPKIRYTHTLYSTINEVTINPDMTDDARANGREATPPDSPSKDTKTRRRASTAERFKSMFRGSKRNKSGKKKKVERASSDPEIPLYPSPPNLEELYSKVNKKTKLKKEASIAMNHESPLTLGIIPLPEGKRHVRQKEYYSDPSNVFNSIDIIVESKTKTKRLKTRSERGSGRRSQQEDSSSDDEFQGISSLKKLSKNSKSSFTDATEERVPPTSTFPPPPTRPLPDTNGIRTQGTHERKISSPRPIKKSPNKYSKSPVVHDVHFDFQPVLNGNSVLLPERQITILKLKTNSSSDHTEEDPVSPPTREGVSLSHPKKRLSVGSPPTSARDLDNSFLFPDKDISTHSLPIKSSIMNSVHQTNAGNTKQLTLKVVSKVVSEGGTSMQPYVNVPQLVKTEIESASNLGAESLNIHSPESRQRILLDRSSQTDSPTSILTDLSINRESTGKPPRPRKPPSLTQHDYPFKQTKLKSSLKRKTDNSSISSTCSSTAFTGDFDQNVSERPNLRVNFGGTTEIPITPNSNVKKRTYPNAAYKEGLHGYLDFKVPYGNYSQHVHFSSDPLMDQRMVPRAVYYPSSLHVPSMLPVPYECHIGESYLDEAFECNQVHPVYNNTCYTEPLAIQYDYNGGIPYHPGPPPFMSYSTDPNIQELRSGAYSTYSKPPTNASCKPSRPAPAPPRNPPNSRYSRNPKQVPHVDNNKNNIKLATYKETTV